MTRKADLSPPAPDARRERLLALVREMPRSSGVYIMKDRGGRELYVGKAKNLRTRVRSYFDAGRLDAKAGALMAAVVDIETVETPTEVEALLLESRLIKDLHPKFNVELKGASYPLVEVTWGETFPRIRIIRDRAESRSHFHGPFVEARELRAALPALRRVFRYCSCPSAVKTNPGRRVRPCLDHHVGLCLAPCAGYVDEREYRAMIRRFEAFLNGRGRRKMLAAIRRRMNSAARQLRFEEAARLRDELAAIESLDRRGDLDSPRPPEPPRVDPAKGLAALQRELELPAPPRRIEGLDLASLSGREAAGSVVAFVDGKPAKGFYRRYRIKNAPGDDDYAQMAEVVSRRARRLAREPHGGPDLLLLDGGPGHLSAALEALSNSPRGGCPGAVCSLSKKAEIIHLPNGRALRLSRTNPALKILQHVRDEAHRFAGQYHRKLRDRHVLPPGKRARRKK
jgi:excinuclease ABC subunit C